MNVADGRSAGSASFIISRYDIRLTSTNILLSHLPASVTTRLNTTLAFLSDSGSILRRMLLCSYI